MSRIEISKLLIVAGVGASICYGTILFSKSRLSDSIRGSIRDSIRGLQMWGKGLLNPIEGQDGNTIDNELLVKLLTGSKEEYAYAFGDYSDDSSDAEEDSRSSFQKKIFGEDLSTRIRRNFKNHKRSVRSDILSYVRQKRKDYQNLARARAHGVTSV